MTDEPRVTSHQPRVTTFAEFFRTATGFEPYDYQRQLACDPAVTDATLDGRKSLATNVPTGAGKTAG